MCVTLQPSHRHSVCSSALRRPRGRPLPPAHLRLLVEEGSRVGAGQHQYERQVALRQAQHSASVTNPETCFQMQWLVCYKCSPYYHKPSASVIAFLASTVLPLAASLTSIPPLQGHNMRIMLRGMLPHDQHTGNLPPYSMVLPPNSLWCPTAWDTEPCRPWPPLAHHPTVSQWRVADIHCKGPSPPSLPPSQHTPPPPQLHPSPPRPGSRTSGPVALRSGGSAASTLCPPSGRQVLAARQAVELYEASMASFMRATFSAPLIPCMRY